MKKKQRKRSAQKRTQRKRNWELPQYLYDSLQMPIDLANLIAAYLPIPFRARLREVFVIPRFPHNPSSFDSMMINDVWYVVGDNIALESQSMATTLPSFILPNHVLCSNEKCFIGAWFNRCVFYAPSGKILHETTRPDFTFHKGLLSDPNVVISYCSVAHMHCVSHVFSVEERVVTCERIATRVCLQDIVSRKTTKELLVPRLLGMCDFELDHIYCFAGSNVETHQVVIGIWNPFTQTERQIWTSVRKCWVRKIVYLRDDKIFFLLERLGKAGVMELCLETEKCTSTCWSFDDITTDGDHLIGLTEDGRKLSLIY